MKKIMILALLCGLTQFCTAQISNKELENEVFKNKANVWVIVQTGTKTIFIRDLLIGLDESEQKILTKEEVSYNYPNLKADFVILAKIKPGTRLLTIKELLDKYKIPNEYRDFLVAKDGIECKDLKTLLASPNYVVNVIVNKEKKFINIITKAHNKFIESRRGAKEDSLERIRLIQQRKNEKPMMPPNKP